MDLVHQMVATVGIPVVHLRQDILDVHMCFCRMLEEDLRHRVELQELARFLDLLVR